MTAPRLRRLATAADYIPWEAHPGLYRLAWHGSLCPGNPTREPEAGAQAFNEWQCHLAGERPREAVSLRLRLMQIVDWCLDHTTDQHAQEIAQLILDARRGVKIEFIPLELDPLKFPESVRQMRYELAFVNPYLPKIPASKVLALQSMIMSENCDERV